jgi:uncharacterized membrane protein HdeD (DUF308 family)
MNESSVLGEITDSLKSNATMLMILGIVTSILGVFALMSPMFSGGVVATMIAIFLIAAGVARLIFSFQAGSFGKGLLAFALGALTIVAGIWMMTRPLLTMLSLSLLLMIYFLVDGIMEIFAAFKAKPLEGWSWMLFGGVVSVILGIIVWRNLPEAALWLVGVLVGIKLIFAGAAMTAIGMTGRRAMKKVQKAVTA